MSSSIEWVYRSIFNQGTAAVSKVEVVQVIKEQRLLIEDMKCSFGKVMFSEQNMLPQYLSEELISETAPICLRNFTFDAQEQFDCLFNFRERTFFKVAKNSMLSAAIYTIKSLILENEVTKQMETDSNAILKENSLGNMIAVLWRDKLIFYHNCEGGTMQDVTISGSPNFSVKVNLIDTSFQLKSIQLLELHPVIRSAFLISDSDSIFFLESKDGKFRIGKTLQLQSIANFKYTKDGKNLIVLFNGGRTLALFCGHTGDLINKVELLVDQYTHISCAQDYFIVASKSKAIIVNYQTFDLETIGNFSGDIIVRNIS